MAYPIGIDLGTTNSVACVWRRGEVETIPVEGRMTLPSVISVRGDGTLLLGHAAKNRAMVEPESSITSVKRLIGDGTSQWEIQGKVYTPKDVSTLILGRLKKVSEEYLGEAIKEAVITVPAYFNNNQKRDTKLAAEAAGFDVLQLLPEPTAAAVSYGLDKGKDQTILVYDLGGGTFDVSVLKVAGNRFQVVAVDGDFSLGGDDLDLLLVDHLIGLLEKRAKKDVGGLRALFGRKKKERTEAPPKEMLLARQQLKEAAEKAKIELSESDSAEVTLPEILGTSLDEEITLATYNGLIEPLVLKTTEKIGEVLKSAKLDATDIDRVILVGGSTRNRLVKELVAEKVKEPWTSDRVDEAVAQGAAIVAGHLSAPEEDLTPIEFSNVTPFSLGVCSYEREGKDCYVNSIIICKNASVPCVESRPYDLQTRPGAGNQLEVYMLQGEDEDPAECLVVGKYVFSGVEHVSSGMAKVEIQYGYDANGIITASATDLATNRELTLDIVTPPEDMSWLSKPPQADRFDPSSLSLMVTPSGYDDVATVLAELSLPFKVCDGSERQLDCDILFWNCLAGEHPDAAVVGEYVRKGGCLYASCCVASDIDGAFGEALRFDHSGCRSETITANVVDQELKAVLGATLRIEYDQAACYTVSKMAPGSSVLLREAGNGRDVMVMVPYGEGHIFYTCFHHHDHLSEAEKKLLQLLVMKQISVVSGIPIQTVSEQISA